MPVGLQLRSANASAVGRKQAERSLNGTQDHLLDKLRAENDAIRAELRKRAAGEEAMAERIAREIEEELAAGEGAESDAIRAEVRRRAAEGAVRFCCHHVMWHGKTRLRKSSMLSCGMDIDVPS